MTFDREQFHELKVLFQEEINTGNVFVAFEEFYDDLILRKDKFRFFNNRDEADVFCIDKAEESFDGLYLVRPVTMVLDDLEKQIQREAAIEANINNDYKQNNLNDMKQENFDYLKNQVKYSGFGDTLEFKLKDEMEKELPEFQLKYAPEFGNGQAEATLNFRKSDQGNYFFNTYDMIVSKEGIEPLKQTFYVNRPEVAIVKGQDGSETKEWVNSTISLKEAFNLMDIEKGGQGRSVLKDFVSKEGEKYTSYIRLDFTNTDNHGNFLIKKMPDFDLEKKLAAHPIKELAYEESKMNLLQSLQKGNRQVVTLVNNGTEYKRAIEVNPQFKTINIYDSGVRTRMDQKEEIGQSSRKAKTVEQKEYLNKSENTVTEKNNKKKLGIS